MIKHNVEGVSLRHCVFLYGKYQLKVGVNNLETIWLEETTNKRAVILFHAYTGKSSDLRMLASFLHRHNYAVYVPTFSGHEHSNAMEILKETPEKWYQDATLAVNFVRSQGYSTIAALGLSMGGMMAAALATNQLVEIAGTFCSPVSTRNAQLPDLFKSFMAFAKNDQMSEDAIIELEIKAKQQLADLNAFSAKVAEKLEQVTGPFYIAQGELDRLVDPEVSIEMKEALVNAAVDFHWFEQSGHVITVGKEKAEFQQSVLEFLDQQEWR